MFGQMTPAETPVEKSAAGRWVVVKAASAAEGYRVYYCGDHPDEGALWTGNPYGEPFGHPVQVYDTREEASDVARRLWAASGWKNAPIPWPESRRREGDA